MVASLVLILTALGLVGCGALLRKLMSHHTVIAAGELLVTGQGEVVIDEVMPRSPELLRHPYKYITVEFDPSQPPPPPCAGGDEPDELRWELIIVRHHHHHGEELRLRIEWDVNSSRTILWSVRAPKH